eukprot:3699020-Amphidinium_carterae.1
MPRQRPEARDVIAGTAASSRPNCHIWLVWTRHAKCDALELPKQASEIQGPHNSPELGVLLPCLLTAPASQEYDS